jgi:hypothetical protein
VVLAWVWCTGTSEGERRNYPPLTGGSGGVQSAVVGRCCAGAGYCIALRCWLCLKDRAAALLAVLEGLRWCAWYARLGRISRHLSDSIFNPPSGIFGFYFKGSAF